jgi:hypothetical protein
MKKKTKKGTVSGAGGFRWNDGKNRVGLIPPEWLWALGDVLTRGSWKYAARNWELGLSYAETLDCLLRHVVKWTAGERYDQESGCHHLAHAAWNCLALMTFDLRDIGDRDLPHLPPRLLEGVNSHQGKQRKRDK